MLGLAAGAAAGGTAVAGLSGCGIGTVTRTVLGGRPAGVPAAPAVSGTPTLAFRSRPDLTPPEVTVHAAVAGLQPGYVFLTAATGSMMIMDNAGQPVWYRDTGTSRAMNFQVQQYQGAPVLTWWEGTITVPDGYVIMDQGYNELHRFSPGNGLSGDLHECRLTAAGTALVTAYQLVTKDLTAFGGTARSTMMDCVVQEVDPASGEVAFQWRASDHIPLSETRFSYTTAQDFDPFHINSIAEEDDDTLVVSARDTWTVYRINRSTGAIVDRLGGSGNQYRQGSGAGFSWQHHAVPHPGGTVTVFDNASNGTDHQESQSRALLLAVDTDARTSSLVKAYTHPTAALSAGSQGSVQPLENGNVFVGWGGEPYASEFSVDGTLLFDASFSPEATSYRAFRQTWSARPAAAPTLVASRNGSGQVVAYVSWNGATEVRAWQLLVGSDTGSDSDLQAVTTTARTGFETTITATAAGTACAVLALDAKGMILSQSATVRL